MALRPSSTLQAANLKRVQELLGELGKGNAEGYFAGFPDDFKGALLPGIIPGGDDIQSKSAFVKLNAEVIPTLMEIKKFEPCNFTAFGNDVLFNVNYEFVWKPTGKNVHATAVVRKVLRNSMIVEKYHILDAEAVSDGQLKSPYNQSAALRVRELLGELGKGNAEGYFAGFPDDFKGALLPGIIQGGDDIQSKSVFVKLNAEVIPTVMEIKKFEPCNIMACPNDNVIFNVNYEFVWKPTGKIVHATALVHKVLKNNMITEKYHLLDPVVIA